MRLARVILPVIAALAFAPMAEATPAINLAVPGDEYVGSEYTLGFEFNVATSQTITALGVYDSGQDGLGAGAQVGLWDTSGNLLTSVSIPSGTGSTLIGFFRYGDIVPFVLTPGTDYLVGAYLADNASSLNTDQGGSGTVNPLVTIVQDRYSDYSTFYFPDSTNFYDSGAWLGANFLLADTGAVPEPATVLLFGAGLTAFASVRRRTRRKIGGITEGATDTGAERPLAKKKRRPQGTAALRSNDTD